MSKHIYKTNKDKNGEIFIPFTIRPINSQNIILQTGGDPTFKTVMLTPTQP